MQALKLTRTVLEPDGHQTFRVDVLAQYFEGSTLCLDDSSLKGAEPVVMGNGWELVEMLVTRHEDADEDAEAAPLDEHATFHDYSDVSCTYCTCVHVSCPMCYLGIGDHHGSVACEVV